MNKRQEKKDYLCIFHTSFLYKQMHQSNLVTCYPTRHGSFIRWSIRIPHPNLTLHYLSAFVYIDSWSNKRDIKLPLFEVVFHGFADKQPYIETMVQGVLMDVPW